MQRSLTDLKAAFAAELVRIADWWMEHAPDEAHGGFLGQVNMDNTPEPGAEKGVILNARILWMFSALARHDPAPRHREMADRAYRYFTEHFIDRAHGGVWWSITAEGDPANRRKQTYAQAFAIYGLSAYYGLTGEAAALDEALAISDVMERHAYDASREGYFEAYAEDWRAIDDVRLSERDLDATKTMNTHLHILEAYTALAHVHRRADTEALLVKNIRLLAEHFIAPRGTHQRLFFDDDWHSLSDEISFGHDIEASWLLHEALLVLNDPTVTARYLPAVRALAEAVLKESLRAFDEGICELDEHTGKPVRIYEWWGQAEAIVGFLNAWELTGDNAYLEAVTQVWSFIENRVLDLERGEWHAYAGDVPADSNLGYKAGFWKGPYHNSRAMMEAVRRLDMLT